MTKIIPNTDFHSRAMKEPTPKTKTPGYNFSYPVLNTIEIGNILMSGGSVDIQIERQGKSTWSFDERTSVLTIERGGRVEIHRIDNPMELYSEMSVHFNENIQRISELNLKTAEKKKKKDYEEPEEFCSILQYPGTDTAYFRWVKTNGWVDRLTEEDKKMAAKIGFHNLG